TRIRKLISLGINKQTAYEWGNTRKGYWRISQSHILNKSLGNKFWQNQGLKSLYLRYEFLRQT
ncbi:group II intron reverse transcriptase/maturase, partial [Gottfriedia acidiceleris]